MQTSDSHHFFWYEYFPPLFFSYPLIFYIFSLIFYQKEASASAITSDTHFLTLNCCIGDFLLLLSFTTVFAGTSPWEQQDSAADVGITGLLCSFQMLLSRGKRSRTPHCPCQFANTSSSLGCPWRSWSPAKVWRWPCWRRGKYTCPGRLHPHCCARGPAPALLPFTPTWTFHNHFSSTLYPEHLSKGRESFSA